MRLINWFNYNSVNVPDIMEVNTLPSKTVPDMTLSIRDLVDRHKAGLNVKTFSPVYSERNVGLEKLDKIERQQLVNDLADFVATSRGKLMTGRQAAIKAANDAAVIAEYEKKRTLAAKVEDAELEIDKAVKPMKSK